MRSTEASSAIQILVCLAFELMKAFVLFVLLCERGGTSASDSLEDCWRFLPLVVSVYILASLLVAEDAI